MVNLAVLSAEREKREEDDSVAVASGAVRTFEHVRAVSSLCAAADQRFLAVGDVKGMVTLYYDAFRGGMRGTTGSKRVRLSASKTTSSAALRVTAGNNNTASADVESPASASTAESENTTNDEAADQHSLEISVSAAGRKQVKHWHAQRVNCLVDVGPFVVSGGEEATLVMWHVDNDTLNFLPRLHGPINFVAKVPAPVESAVALALRDNSVAVVDMLNCSFAAGSGYGGVGTAVQRVAGLSLPVASLAPGPDAIGLARYSGVVGPPLVQRVLQFDMRRSGRRVHYAVHTGRNNIQLLDEDFRELGNLPVRLRHLHTGTVAVASGGASASDASQWTLRAFAFVRAEVHQTARTN